MFCALSKLASVLILGTVLCIPAYAGIQAWSTLTPKQQEALTPIALQWDTLPEKLQKRLLSTTKSFQTLSPEKKQLFHKRLIEWSTLTPAQRKRAREKYKAFKKVSPDKREEVKRMVLQQEAEKAKEKADKDNAIDQQDDAGNENIEDAT